MYSKAPDPGFRFNPALPRQFRSLKDFPAPGALFQELAEKCLINVKKIITLDSAIGYNDARFLSTGNHDRHLRMCALH